ncbi:glycosyltransferase [Brachybacterium huguangmaarense]
MTSILHVTDASFAGVLVAVTDIARSQSELPGNRVTFAYVPRAQTPPLDEIQELAGEAVQVVRLGSSARLAVPTMLARLGGLIAREDPDVIHLHASRAGLIGRAVGLLRGARGRVVYSPHGFAFDRAAFSPPKRTVYAGLESLGARLAPALALCSPSEEAVARRRLPHARTAVLANGVDADRLGAIAANRPPRAPHEPLRIVHVGRIGAQKMAPLFGRIATAWLEAPPRPARFVWIGEGDRRLLPPGVEITGWLGRDALLSELSRADLVLFTSDGEAMPMALLEAHAMGVPVVGSRVTGVFDVVEDGVTGLVREGEADLALALASLALDDATRARFSEAAMRRIRENFTTANLADRSFAAYATLGLRSPEGHP